jgi:DNA polymerase III epsilon subunit-like protein
MANTDVMIDLETLDVLPTATILTIGAVKFDPFGDENNQPAMEKFYVKVDIDSCDAVGGTVSQSTLEWWAKQSAAAQADAFDPTDRLPINEALTQLYKFCWGAKRAWSHGVGFDLIILETYFRKIEKSIPWQFWEMRDTRTLFDIGINPNRATVTAHNALADAVDQALGVQKVYRTLRSSTMSDGNYIAPFANQR